MYPNLLYNIFQKISEKYHLYLRLVSPRCYAISKRLNSEQTLSELIGLKFHSKPNSSDTENDLEKICKNQKIIHLGEILKQGKLYLNEGLAYSCYIGNKILIKCMIDISIREMENDKGAKTWSVEEEKEVPSLDWNVGLYNACRGNNLEIVQLMIAKGANEWGVGLYNACRSGNLEIVQLMIAKGANFGCSWGLCCACEGGNLEIAQLMIIKCVKFWGVGFPYWDWGLYYACIGGNLEIVQLMLDKGATNLDKCIQSDLVPNYVKEYLRNYLANLNITT